MPDAITSAVRKADTSAMQTAAEKRGEELNNRFLTLLVAQMENQTPLKPMDSSQVTSQIAQVNTVSGINKLNKTLSSITKQIDTTQQLQASALIGHGVLVDGNKISVGHGEDDSVATTPFGYDLDKPAKKVEVDIVDGAGETVYHAEYANQPAGTQSYQWDGKDTGGNVVDGNSYKVLVKATGLDGKPVDVQPLTMHLVNGVIASDDGPKLDLGPNGGTATLDEVRQIVS